MRNRFYRVTLALVVLIAGPILTSGCSDNLDDPKLSIFHGRLRDNVKTLDPATSYDSVSWRIVPQIYESLYQYAYLKDPYEIEPNLAADFPSVSKDQKTITIRIKKGVKFQDDACFKATGGKGRELVADDFIYQWKRLALPAIQSQGFWIFDGKVVGMSEFHEKLGKAKKEDIAKIFKEGVPGLKALDSHTIQIQLVRPYPQLLYILSMPFTTAIAHEAAEMYADENGNLHDHPVGTGPFLLKEWRRGHRVVLDRNPNFRADFYPTEGHSRFKEMGMLKDSGKPLPFIDRSIWSVIKEDQPMWLNLMKGKLDAGDLPKDNFQASITDKQELSPELIKKGLAVQITSEPIFYYVSFNMMDSVVGKNKALRQAISSAFDREKFIELFRNGRGKKMTSVLPEGIIGRPKNPKLKYDYDLEKAKALLAKAGYPGGNGLPPLKFDMRGADSLYRQIGDFFQQQLGNVGIQTQIIYNTFPAYLEKAKQGHLQVSIGAWIMDYPDPENAFQLLYGPNKAPGPNEANFDHKRFNELYDLMAVAPNGPKRERLIQELDDLVQEEVPWALIYTRIDYYPYQAWLKNYRPDEILLNAQKYYRIDKAEKEKYLKLR